MTSKDFCYWLQGYFELAGTVTLNEKQVKTIKAHLNMVFVHEIDPSYGDKNHQATLQEIHDNVKVMGPVQDPETKKEIEDLKKQIRNHDCNPLIRC